MSTRKVIVAVIAAALLLVLLVGIQLWTDNRYLDEDESTVNAEEVTVPENDEVDDGIPVLRIFDKNMSGATLDDEVIQTIMEKAGVRIELMDPNNMPDETLELMLMNEDLPDIILMEQNEMLNQFIEAGVFIELDDLIQKKGPNISEMYGNILDKCRYTNGKIYWFANWYGEDSDVSAGVLMRKDYLTELVGEERANSTDPFTVSEYTDILHRFKEKYETIDGRPSIALDLDSASGNYESTLKGIFGMKTYGIDENGKLHYLPATERYKEAMLWLNDLYRDDLICKQWIIDQSGKWEADLNSGAVFSTWAAYWDTDDINVRLTRKYGEQAQFYCYKVMADDLKPKDTTFNGRNSLGWDAIGITKNCKNTDAAMRLLDFLASEEGQYLMLWGIEGDSWEMINGRHVPKRVFLYDWFANPSLVERIKGVRKWKWMIKNGNGSDGTPFDLTTKYVSSDSASFANARFKNTDYWDTAEFSGLEPTVKSDAGLQWEKITQLYKDNFGSIICATDREEAEALYNRMVSNMELSGLSECENYITNKYISRQEKWK